jgi:hypothetical protein
MKKEIAQLVLNSLSSNSVMIERAALMQERWGHVNLDEIATPIVKRVLIDMESIQNFLNEKYPGIKITMLEINTTSQKFEPMLSFREEHPDMWTQNSYDRWWNAEYSLEEKEGWRKRSQDWNNCTVEFSELGIPEEFYRIEWL